LTVEVIGAERTSRICDNRACPKSLAPPFHRRWPAAPIAAPAALRRRSVHWTSRRGSHVGISMANFVAWFSLVPNGRIAALVCKRRPRCAVYPASMRSIGWPNSKFWHIRD